MINFVITYSGEIEIFNLLKSLLPQLDRTSHHVFFLCDDSKLSTNKSEVNPIVNITLPYVNSSVVFNTLNNDFSQHRNFIHNSIEDGQYIVQLDADETVSNGFVNACNNIASSGMVDVCYIPRINTVEDITQEHLVKWNWRLDEQGRINYPDYQGRMYLKKNYIQWVGEVHEKLECVDYKRKINLFYIPINQEKIVIYHHKKIERQIQQNNFYDTI
jgi:hypothetical protein